MQTVISVVIPVYNSQGNLVELERQIRDGLSGHEYQVVLVNDQSTDGSWREICEIAKDSPQVVGVNLRKNFGQDNAIMAGLKYAKGDVVVIMDDDLQHTPSAILRLVEQVRLGFDVCFAEFPTVKQAAWKNWGSRLNGAIANVAIGKPKEIYLSPFKAMSGDVAKELLRYEGPFPYVDGLIFLVTRNVTQVPVEHQNRFHGKSNYNLIRSIRVFLKTVTSFSILPLRIASVLGFLSALIGFGLGMYYLLEYLLVSKGPEGWTTLVLVNLLIGGMILVSIGMVGEYVGRAYLTLNKHPQSVVKEITNEEGAKQ